MRIAVDAERCQGHQMCAIAAPELFGSDEFGYAVVIGDGSVAPELEGKARRAAANCPENAVVVGED